MSSYAAVAIVAASVACAPAVASKPSENAVQTSSDVVGIGRVNLPSAKNGHPLTKGAAPTISVVDGKIHLDGRVVGSSAAIVQSKRLQRVDELFEVLKAERERWKAAHPNEEFPGKAQFAFDAATPALVIKSVFQTTAFAGYPNGEFAARDAGAVTSLDVDAIVPTPSSSPLQPPGARLLIVVRPTTLAVEWHKDGALVSSAEVGSIADLQEAVRKEWARYAAHTERNDQVFDQALLYLNDGVDYARVIAVLDAVRATTREISVGEASKRVPALNATLTMHSDHGKIERDPLERNGRLPPETIQKIVRQNFGTLRSCYEDGLGRNRALAGRLAVKFVIGRSGKVGDVSDGGSSLPDQVALECMMDVFSRMTFPPPDGGIVTVVYPIIFSPDDTSATPPPEGGGVGLGSAH